MGGKYNFQWAILSWNIPIRSIRAWQPKLGVNHSLKFCPWTVCLSPRLWGQDSRQTGCWGGFHGYSWASLWPDCWKKKTMRKNFKEELPSCLATQLSGRTALSLLNHLSICFSSVYSNLPLFSTFSLTALSLTLSFFYFHHSTLSHLSLSLPHHPTTFSVSLHLDFFSPKVASVCLLRSVFIM